MLRFLLPTSWLAFGALVSSVRQALASYPGVPVLQNPKICPEFSAYGGTPVPTRYYANDCRVEPSRRNASRERQAIRDLNIVVMAPGVGPFGDALSQSEPYVSMAVQDIEDSDFLQGYRFNAYVADSQCSAQAATANTIRAMTTGPPKHGMFGSTCSDACEAINDAIQYFNVLQVSHTCVSVGLSDLNRYPFFTRVTPNYKNTVLTIREVIMGFGWTRVGVIAGYRDVNTLGRDMFLELAENDISSQAYGWTILMVASVSSKALAAQAVTEVRMRDARIVCNAVYEDMGALLMCEASKQGMFSPSWIQLALTGTWQGPFLLVMQPYTDCTLEQLYKSGFGWLLGHPQGGYIASTAPHGLSHRRITDIYDQYREECVTIFGSTRGCNDWAAYVYDGVWHFAFLLHKYLIVENHTYEELNTPASRERQFNLSLEVDFVGLTGRVRQYNYADPTTPDFAGSIGDREGPAAIRQLTGPPSEAMTVVGYWLPSGLVWQADVVWSADDPSKMVPCASGQCDLSSGWIPADSAPEECPNNTVWASDTGCTPCAAGEFTNGTRCLPCDGGTASSQPGQISCEPCAPGRFSKLLASVSCDDCQSGRFSATAGASECTPCPQGGFESGTGSSACTSCGSVLVTPLRGATSADECVCPSGTYRPLSSWRGTCAACPEGVDCSLGTDLNIRDSWPVIREGYYADLSLSVFKCLDDGLRCRQGVPGHSCAPGRRGRVCADCQDGMAPTADGSCKTCSAGAEFLPLVLFVAAAVLLLGAAYYAFDSSDVTRRSHHTLLIVMTLSLFVTMMQQLGALAVVSVAWPAPMRSLFRIFAILAFDMEALKMGCIVQPKPVGSFSLKVIMFGTCILLIVLIHVVSVLLRGGGRFRERNHTLISSVGTVFIVFYVSVFISILAPLQCARNPNGIWTLKPYPSVICWEGSAEHSWMLALGALTSLGPIGFLVHCCRVIWMLPYKMREGDTRFLRSYAFLFFRYQPSAYWYSLVHLARSLLIALTTIVPVAGVQVLLMQVVLLLQLALVSEQQPWRVPKANSLESLLTIGVMMMLCCAALITGSSEGDMALAWTFVALLLAACAAIAGTAVYAVYLILVHRRRKPFTFFICHHKAGAGCLARLINLEFTSRWRKAFIDTDDLRDLDKLFDYVATQTQTLLVLCSKFVFTRPWCIGEVVTAMHAKVHVAKVVLTDFAEPSEEFIADYEEVAGGDLLCLTECGIDVPEIQETLRWVSTLAGCAMPPKLSAATVRLLCTTLAKKEVTSISHVADKVHPDTTVVVIADLSSVEVACTSFILVDLLTMHTEGDVTKVPMVLTQDHRRPNKTSIFLLICSSEALSQRPVLLLLWQMYIKAVQGLPVVQDENFTFPDSQYFIGNASRMSLLKSVVSQPDEVWGLSTFVLDIFKVIATLFQPSHYGSTRDVLHSKAKELAGRIQKRKAAPRTMSYAQLSSGQIRNLAVHSSNELAAQQDLREDGTKVVCEVVTAKNTQEIMKDLDDSDSDISMVFNFFDT